MNEEGVNEEGANEEGCPYIVKDSRYSMVFGEES